MIGWGVGGWMSTIYKCDRNLTGQLVAHLRSPFIGGAIILKQKLHFHLNARYLVSSSSFLFAFVIYKYEEQGGSGWFVHSTTTTHPISTSLDQKKNWHTLNTHTHTQQSRRPFCLHYPSIYIVGVVDPPPPPCARNPAAAMIRRDWLKWASQMMMIRIDSLFFLNVWGGRKKLSTLDGFWCLSVDVE